MLLYIAIEGGFNKPLNITKTLNFTKGSIEVRYNGIPSDNADLDKIDALLENFINNQELRELDRLRLAELRQEQLTTGGMSR